MDPIDGMAPKVRREEQKRKKKADSYFDSFIISFSNHSPDKKNESRK